MRAAGCSVTSTSRICIQESRAIWLGLDAKDLAPLYDVGVLTYVGCLVYGNESAVLFGDDIDLRAHVVEVDLAGFPAMMFMLRRAGHGTGAVARLLRRADL